jgi:hypothetical protein
MPLIKSASKAAIGQNIREMSKTHPHDQAVAAALDTARRASRDSGGPLPGLASVPGVRPLQQLSGAPSQKIHTGPIHSSVAGRTDHLPVATPSGSFVLPADIVSGMGDGNTMAGFKVIKRMFAGNPYSQANGPYPHNKGASTKGTSPYGLGSGPYGAELSGSRAKGGKTSEVPVVVAGGEFTLTPDEVLMAGDGDLERGHRVLDDFIVRYRKKLIKTLSKLPGPRHD